MARSLLGEQDPFRCASVLAEHFFLEGESPQCNSVAPSEIVCVRVCPLLQLGVHVALSFADVLQIKNNCDFMIFGWSSCSDSTLSIFNTQ